MSLPGGSARALLLRVLPQGRADTNPSAVKNPESPDFSIGPARIPALHFSGIRGV